MTPSMMLSNISEPRAIIMNDWVDNFLGSMSHHQVHAIRSDAYVLLSCTRVVALVPRLVDRIATGAVYANHLYAYHA
jgi:hypothetical protein